MITGLSAWVRRLRLRRAAFQLHRWLGLIAGILLIAISLSGVALTFRQDLDRKFDSDLYRVSIRGQPKPYNDLLARLALHKIAGRIEALRLPEEPDAALTADYDDAGFRRKAWIDPYTGNLLAVRPETGTVTGWLLTLHYRLLAGDGGEIAAGLVAIILVLAAASGFYVQGRLFVSLLRRPRAKRLLRDTHVFIGSWALLASVLFGLSGAWMCRFALIRILDRSERHGAVSQKPIQVDRLLASARSVPFFKPRIIVYPSEFGQPVEVLGAMPVTGQNWFYGILAYRLTADPDTGAILSRFDPIKASLLETADNWIFTIHSGQYLEANPVGVKLVYASFGSTPALLAASGFWIYIRRFRRRVKPRSSRR